MATSTPHSAALEQKLLDIAKTLPVHRILQVIDFASWLKTVDDKKNQIATEQED